MGLEKQKMWVSNWARRLLLDKISEVKSKLVDKVEPLVEQELKKRGLGPTTRRRRKIVMQMEKLRLEDRELQREILGHIHNIPASEVVLGYDQEGEIRDWEEGLGWAAIQDRGLGQLTLGVSSSKDLQNLQFMEQELAAISSAMNSISSQVGLRAWRKKVADLLDLQLSALELAAMNPPAATCLVVHRSGLDG